MKWKKNWTFSSKLEKNSFIYKHFAFQWTNSRGKYNFKNFSNFFRKLLTMKIWLIRFDKNANPNPEIIIDSRSNKYFSLKSELTTHLYFSYFFYFRDCKLFRSSGSDSALHASQLDPDDPVSNSNLSRFIHASRHLATALIKPSMERSPRRFSFVRR